MRNKIIIYLILAGVLLFATIPLFKPYVPGTADGLAHKFRVVSFEKSLKEGNIRPRWLSDQALGFGTPVYMFLYSLPYYVVSGLNFAGFEINRATQIFEAGTLILSGLFMFLLVRKLYGSRAGITASAIYTLAPYHLTTIYLYEGWGEMASFIFPPLILYLTLLLESKDSNNPRKISNFKFPISNFKSKKQLYFLFLVFSWVLFVITHNVSVLMFAPFLLFLSFIIYGLKIKKLLLPVSAFCFSVLITAYFWLPAIFLNKWTQYPLLISKEMWMRSAFFKSLTLLFTNAFSTVRAGVVRYYDFTLGIPIMLVLIISFCYIMFRKIRLLNSLYKDISKHKKAGTELFMKRIIGIAHSIDLFFVGIIFMAFLSLFLSNGLSNAFWNIPFLHYVVYPFRFLFPVTFASAVIAGKFAKKNILISIILIVLSLVSGWPFVHPYVDIFPFPDSYFRQVQPVNNPPYTKKNMATIEFLPKWASLQALNSIEQKYLSNGMLPDKIMFDKSFGSIENQKIASEKIQAGINLNKDASVTINTFYFPNWQASVNGRKIPLTMNSDGLMTLALQKGRNDVELIFALSGLEKAANIISLIGVLLLPVVIILSRRSNNRLYSK
jgi:hypothetical protein